MAECTVCVGLGRYPVINKYGTELYTIACPECEGAGEEYDPVKAAEELAARCKLQQYEAVMAEKRAREAQP